MWLQDPELRARQAPFRTNIALAIDVVEVAIRPKVPCGVVVFDAWSLAEAVIRGLARRRQDGSSRLKQNRLLEPASVHRRDAKGWTLKRPSPHLAVKERVPRIPATAYRPVTSRAATYWCFTRGVRIPGWGKVRSVISCAHESLPGRAGVLVTNRLDWSAAQIIGRYLRPTDTFDQDSQGPWGFNAYRLRSADALENHGCLVCVASSLWPLTCLPTGPDRAKGLIHTMGDACRPQGRALLQQLWVVVHDQLSHGATADHVFAQLFATQQGLVFA